jgi:DnaJ-class molecular chaperone
LIEISVRPHTVFSREGNDIHLELPISLSEAVLGGKINVPTPSGSVTMTLPKWSNTGRVLRLKGKGAPRPDGSRGDEYVTLKVMLPEKPDRELQEFVGRWRPAAGAGPRPKMEA